MKTLVNTATIQWIHSTTKYHEAKVTTTKTQKIHVHFVSEIPQLGKQSKRSPRSPSHLEETNLVINFVHNNEVNTCTDIITYRNTPTGKTRKRSPRLPATQKPRNSLSLKLGWTITKLYTYQFTSRLTQPKPYS